jgi:hypothetical protein
MKSWAPPLLIESHCHAIAAWGVVGEAWRKKSTTAPPPTRCSALRIAKAPASPLSPPQDQQGIAATLAAIAPKIF